MILNKLKRSMRLKRHIKTILSSEYFDKTYYCSHYRDVQRSSISPEKHYFHIGWKEGRNPSDKFHTNFYLRSNKDVAEAGINPLLHYLLKGKTEGRRPRPESSELYSDNVVLHGSKSNSSSVYQLLFDSPMFCSKYYNSHYPDVDGCAISHYIEHGFKEGRNPSHEFNTNYYLESNPDVVTQDINPLVHWLLYGQYEGRKTRQKYVNRSLISIPNTPSIIFVSHEASETGAPAVLLSLMAWLKANTKINFSIVVGASGPWNYKFEKIAPTFFLDRPHCDADIKSFCGDHVQSIYVNTIASASYAKKLEFLHAEYITHVHEMENVFKIFEEEVGVLKSLCKKFVAVSPGSIASINRRMPTSEIAYLKPFIDRYCQTEDIEHPAPEKKIVFGCGAVEERKGFDLFCDVAKALKNIGSEQIEMHWVGSDENKDLNAIDTINKRGVSDIVKFLGPKDNPRDYFKYGDVFLLTSREDPYPLVCMEAAEFRLPVICFDSKAGGMHTFVEEDAGIVIPYLNVEKMALTVKELVFDQERLAILGERAQQKVEERHYVDVIAPQILSLLPDLALVEANSSIEKYKALIRQAKVISFDIFDTLVTREVAVPETVFDISEYKHTKSESGILSLFEERMKTAGKVLASHNGRLDDISIDEIYQNMPLYRNSSIEKETERAVCIAHSVGKELYNYARELGKPIYITSDMYLDQETIQAILNDNGFDYWDEFFLSSVEGKKKDTGKLFDKLKAVALKSGISSDQILHIGDNWSGDVKHARQAGLNAVRFSPIYESKNKLITLSEEQKQTMSQSGRVWDSFTTQAARLWCEENSEISKDFYTKLGFEVTGPLASMMAMHSKTVADSKGIKKIVFMARDGRVIKKAFDTLYQAEIASGEYESDYFHLSRATVVPATLEHPLSSNDLYFLIEGLHLAEKPLSYYLNKAKLDCTAQSVKVKVRRYFKSLDFVPDWNDFTEISKMLESLSEDIHIANKQHRTGLYRYLEEKGFFDVDKVLVVDVGWLLNIQSRLERFIQSTGKSTEIIGSYVGSRERVNKSLKHSSILYDLGEPFYYSKFLEENVTLFEVLFSSPEASASSISIEDGKPYLAFKPIEAPLPKEYEVSQKLQMGAEVYFERLFKSQNEYFPKVVSTDYFFNIFKALVYSESDLVKAELDNFEIRLGGHHEFVSRQNLTKSKSYTEYKMLPVEEYFEPIFYDVDSPSQFLIIVTSAGLSNGSTRYRALNFAESLQFKKIKSVVIHSQTAIDLANEFISAADSIIFQRCFSDQGNVGEFYKLARKKGIKCVGDMDDLVFPEHIASIGSVKGGEWDIRQAEFVASSYEKFLLQMDSCNVSTPALKEYIEDAYKLPCTVEANKISVSKIRLPIKKVGALKLIYASGTYSHKEDFELIEQTLYEFLSANGEVTLSILGATQSSERILALPNVSSYPLLPYDAMLDFVAKHDVMLVPLVDDIFNNAKSNVKFIECASVGTFVLASNVREYVTTANSSESIRIFSKDSFSHELNKLLDLDFRLRTNDLTSFSTKGEC